MTNLSMKPVVFRVAPDRTIEITADHLVCRHPFNTNARIFDRLQRHLAANEYFTPPNELWNAIKAARARRTITAEIYR